MTIIGRIRNFTVCINLKKMRLVMRVNSREFDFGKFQLEILWNLPNTRGAGRGSVGEVMPPRCLVDINCFITCKKKIGLYLCGALDNTVAILITTP